MNTLRIETMAVIGEELCVTFDDSVELYLPLPMLRRACPCAACQGEPDALGRVVKPRIDLTESSLKLRQITPVGSYALQLFWQDGHGTGIYSFSYLRELSQHV
ncbi:MAG: gamma-butyrobetaine hydroxylase-like domain-containing protein [Akkermansiaceae bacterium]